MEFRRKIALWLCPELTRCFTRDAENEPHKLILTLCDMYAAHAGLSHWRVSYLSRGDGQFFKRLRGGASCTLKTADKVLVWFSDNWPDADLAWPSDIPRPPKSTKNRRAA